MLAMWFPADVATLLQELVAVRTLSEIKDVLEKVASISASADATVSRQPPPGVQAARTAWDAFSSTSRQLSMEAFLSAVLLRHQEVSFVSADSA